MRNLIFVIQLSAAVYLLWLGLYMLARTYLFGQIKGSDIEQRPAWFIVIAGIAASVYMLGVAMETVAQTAEEFLLWQRLTWWTSTYSVSFFLLSVVYLDRAHIKRPVTRTERALVLLLLTISTLMAVGAAAGFFSQTENVLVAEPFGVFFTPPRMPQYLAFGLWTIGLLTITVILLLRRSWKAYRQSSMGDTSSGMRRGDAFALAAAGVLIFIGAFVSVFGNSGMRQLGMVGIAAGSGFIGIAITRYQAFLYHRNAVRDFGRSLLSTSIMLATYVGILYAAVSLLGYTVQPISIALVCFLVVITRAPIGWEERLSDRVFLPQWMVGYRRQLMAISDDSLTALEPEKAILEAEPNLSAVVHEAQREQLCSIILPEIEYIFQYSRFNDDALLAKSQLQTLRTINAYKHIQEDAPQSQNLGAYDDALALRTLLTALIDDEIAAYADQDDLRENGIGLILLREKYIEQKTRVEVKQMLLGKYGLALRGGAYSRNLKAARIQIAKRLCVNEMRLRPKDVLK